MDKLTKEEVLHVANLGRLELNEDEVEKYSYQLKEILNEIEKINDVISLTDEIMISPNNNECFLTDDKEGKMLEVEELLKNANNVYEDYIEVRGAFDE